MQDPSLSYAWKAVRAAKAGVEENTARAPDHSLRQLRHEQGARKPKRASRGIDVAFAYTSISS